MASTELTIPGGDNKLTIPAHIAARFRPEESNIITGDRVPSLTIKGKVFTIQADGEVTPLMKRDDEGNEYPLANLPVVILDYAARLGRNYFEGAYDPNEVKPPTCWSLDGITPEAEVPDDIKDTQTSWKCATCPMAVKGSSVTDNGKAATACAQHRILAVVPIKRLDLPPMRLRIAQTSNYDGRSPDLKAKNLYAFSNYLDAIKARGIPHTQSVVTQLSFDPNAAYPKLLFRAQRYVDDTEIEKIDAILASGAVETILGRMSATLAKSAPAIAAPARAPAIAAPKAAAAVVVPADDEDDEEAQIAAARAAIQAKKAAKAAEDALLAQQAEAQAQQAKARQAAAKAAAEAKAKAEAEAASLAAADAAAIGGDDDEDEEAKLLAQLLAKRAAKQAAAAAGAAAPAKAAAPAAEAPKRTRRTKAEVEADNIAKAKANGEPLTPNGDAKVFPKSVGGADLADDDDDGNGALTGEVIAPAKKAETVASKPKVIEAATLAVPSEVQDMLSSWDD